MGNYADSGWVSTCSTSPMSGGPGLGNWSVLVPHSNAPGCGWSRLYQFVPSIADGETWTLSGWCANFTSFWADPYIGYRFGVKDALGNLSWNTAALMNTGVWTYLQVTNSFTLAPGDTVFVECDPGAVSGLGGNQVWAMFDGIELTSLSTSVTGPTAPQPLRIRPNPVIDRLWVAMDEPAEDVQVIAADGSVHSPLVIDHGNTLEVDVTGEASGMHVLLVRTATGVRTARFVQL